MDTFLSQGFAIQRHLLYLFLEISCLELSILFHSSMVALHTEFAVSVQGNRYLLVSVLMLYKVYCVQTPIACSNCKSYSYTYFLVSVIPLYREEYICSNCTGPSILSCLNATGIQKVYYVQRPSAFSNCTGPSILSFCLL